MKRQCAPKAKGGKRPLGIPALENKIVKGALAEVLLAVYPLASPIIHLSWHGAAVRPQVTFQRSLVR